ncbi:transporter [Desulfuromonas versatilis]|uniref:Transporter n=1 Tax=Desulfuromonas versatilis TaxID=2802975 RepID=A0ABM8HSL7_9BACT|nr:AEC family transporter [Desulfuromonas versatilis]BCR04971.1 transporter [Desulfuromonas versatilis]
MLFIEIILPVFLTILAGFVLEKKSSLDFRTLTNCSLYLFVPALIFSALIKREIRFDLAFDLFLFMIFYTLAMLALSVVIGRSLRMDPDTRGALSLTTVVMNSGNFGLPLAYFAFGDPGLEASILIFVLFNIPLSTLAIVLAQGSAASLREALVNTFKIPLFHAVALAFAVKALQVPCPPFLLRPLELLGQAAIPLMLVLLGMQLARTRLQLLPGFLSLATLLRLAIAPLVALGVTGVLGIHGLERQVAILQTSTPSAILPLLYSLRFGTRPDLVAGAIFVTTLLSAVSLTVLLYLLQG